MWPLGAVVTHKVRMIDDFSLDPQYRVNKVGMNGDTDPDTVPPCLRAVALPKFLSEIVRLRQKYPEKRILMSKAHVSDAFRNVRVDPEQAHNLCYTVGDLVVIDFRHTFGVVGVPRFIGGHGRSGRALNLPHIVTISPSSYRREIIDGAC